MYREVTMIEFREVLRLWQEQVPKKRIVAQMGLDPKTVAVFECGRSGRAASFGLDAQRRAGARCVAGAEKTEWQNNTRAASSKFRSVQTANSAGLCGLCSPN